MPIEDAFEVFVEIFNRQRAWFEENAADLHAWIRIG